MTVPPSIREVQGDLACGSCARVIGIARGRYRGVVTFEPLRPEYAVDVAQLRCPYCSGRLWVGETAEVPPERRKLTTEELAPRRGRPAKGVTR